MESIPLQIKTLQGPAIEFIWFTSKYFIYWTYMETIWASWEYVHITFYFFLAYSGTANVCYVSNIVNPVNLLNRTRRYTYKQRFKRAHQNSYMFQWNSFLFFHLLDTIETLKFLQSERREWVMMRNGGPL